MYSTEQNRKMQNYDCVLVLLPSYPVVPLSYNPICHVLLPEAFWTQRDRTYAMSCNSKVQGWVKDYALSYIAWEFCNVFYFGFVLIFIHYNGRFVLEILGLNVSADVCLLCFRSGWAVYKCLEGIHGSKDYWAFYSSWIHSGNICVPGVLFSISTCFQGNIRYCMNSEASSFICTFPLAVMSNKNRYINAEICTPLLMLFF